MGVSVMVRRKVEQLGALAAALKGPIKGCEVCVIYSVLGEQGMLDRIISLDAWEAGIDCAVTGRTLYPRSIDIQYSTTGKYSATYSSPDIPFQSSTLLSSLIRSTS